MFIIWIKRENIRRFIIYREYKYISREIDKIICISSINIEEWRINKIIKRDK